MSFVLKFDPSSGIVLGIRPSANTPDYAGREGFLINPDMSQVKGVSRERWRVKNGELVVAPEVAPLVLSSETKAFEALSALAEVHNRSLITGSLEWFESSNDPTLVSLAYSLRFFESKAPILSEVASSFLVDTLFSIIPGTGGIPSLWQTPIELKRSKYLADFLSNVVKNIEHLENRIDQLETENGIELSTQILEFASSASDEHELDAAKKVFRYLAIGGVSPESTEITKCILELRTLHLLVLRDVGYWTEVYEEPTKEQLLPKGIAESLSIEESVVQSAISKLVSVGFLYGSSFHQGYASEYSQVSLSELGQKAIEILEQ